jgi:hypothetical protein
MHMQVFIQHPSSVLPTAYMPTTQVADIPYLVTYHTYPLMVHSHLMLSEG